MKHRIVVLGAGYAGAIAAGRLAKRLHPDDTEITVVNADPDFVERVRMHQLATGQDLKPRALSDVYAGTGVQVRLARVTAVDADRKTVGIADADGPGEIAYDTLVYALGSAAADHGVPGVAEHAYNIAGKQSALRLRDAARRPRPRRGPCSSSAAASPASKRSPRSPRPDRTSTSRSPPAAASATGSARRPSSTCARHSTGSASPSTSTPTSRGSRPTGAVTADGRAIPAQVTVWTAGFAVHPIAAATTLAGRRDRADRRRRHDAVGLAPRRVRRRRRRDRRGPGRHSHCGCPAPRESPWPGRPPTPSPPA